MTGSGQRARRANYAIKRQKFTADFLEFLRKSGVAGLSPIISVIYQQLLTLGGVDLTIATCNDRHSSISQEVFLLPAGKAFLGDKNFANFEFIKFPKSMQKLQDFLSSGDLVETVDIFGGDRSIDSPTAHGRHFLQMLIAALFKNYSNGIYLNGEFSTTEIVIFDYGSSSQWIEILKKPAEADNRTKKMRNNSKVNDMHTVAALIMSLYMKSDGSLPLYFYGLINDLQTVACDEVGEPWFKDYLCYHVAFMHSDGRKYLENTLYSIYDNCQRPFIPFMAEKHPMYADDWRKRVNEAGKDNIGQVLNLVYKYHRTQFQLDPYEESVRGLLKFKRNVHQHGGRHIRIEAHHLWHLELLAANMFCEFLPFLVRTLLMPRLLHGQMVPALTESFFKEAWDGFKLQGLR